MLQQYVPCKASQLRAMAAKSMAEEEPDPIGTEFRSLLDAKNYDRAAEIAQKSPDELKQAGLYQIAEALLESDDREQARKFVSSQITNSEMRQQLLDRLNSADVDDAARKGDEETTRRLMPELAGVEQRLAALLSLARKTAEKGEKEKAAAILQEAEALPAQKSEQLTSRNMIASAYINVSNARSVELLTAQVEKLNTLLSAASVLDGYFTPECNQDGELRFFSPSPLFPQVIATCDVLANLAEVDVDRGVAIAKGFAQPELQILAVLLIGQRLVTGTAQPSEAGVAGVSFVFGANRIGGFLLAEYVKSMGMIHVTRMKAPRR